MWVYESEYYEFQVRSASTLRIPMWVYESEYYEFQVRSASTLRIPMWVYERLILSARP